MNKILSNNKNICRYDSPMGEIMITGDSNGLSGLWFYGQKYAPVLSGEEYEDSSFPLFTDTKLWLDIYFSGKAPDFTPPLNLVGTDFQKSVWNILLSVPYGKIATYGEIAGKIASKRGLSRMSAQAVGQAVGHNPIAIIVPCHRVLGTNGSLTGYAGGLARKKFLLSLENNLLPLET